MIYDFSIEQKIKDFALTFCERCTNHKEGQRCIYRDNDDEHLCSKVVLAYHSHLWGVNK